MSRLVPLIVVVVLLVVAGCGSSENSESAGGAATGGGGSLSKAEFVARADALCEASKAEQEPLRQKLEGVTRKARGEEQGEGLSDGTRKELARALGQIVAKAEASLSRVQALGVPEADGGQLEAIFRGIESAFRSSLAYGAALEHREDARAQAIAERANAETRETAALAQSYGFKVCGAQP